MQYFSNLLSLNMSDNEAPFEPLGNLPSLLELDFQCNALRDIQPISGTFNRLELLDLSHNFVSRESLLNLSSLLRLRELHLENNSIRRLPPIMDKFSKVEILSLGWNNLSSQDDLITLSTMPRLKHLNLAHNKFKKFAAFNSEDEEAFSVLEYLNLSHNVVTNEDDIFGITKVLKLQKLVLYGNPIAHAAVTPQDPTKLAYDPIPSITYDDDTGEKRPLVIVIAYPSTLKKKKNQTRSSYEKFKLASLERDRIPSNAAFKSKGNKLLFNKEETVQKQEKVVERDSVFLTGVYDIEETCLEEELEYNEFPELQTSISSGSTGSGNSGAVPTSLFSKSIIGGRAPKKVDQAKLRSAISQLRYFSNLISHMFLCLF